MFVDELYLIYLRVYVSPNIMLQIFHINSLLCQHFIWMYR